MLPCVSRVPRVQEGLAHLDATLLPKPLAALVQHLLEVPAPVWSGVQVPRTKAAPLIAWCEATVWYSPQAAGSYLKASLFDGLHDGARAYGQQDLA